MLDPALFRFVYFLASRQEGDHFLMCSKKRPNNATSNYIISMRMGDLERSSKNFLGKLRANFVGTEFEASPSRAIWGLLTFLRAAHGGSSC